MATVKELKAQAKAKGIKGYSKMRKAELEKAVGGGSKAKGGTKPAKKKQSLTAFIKANKDKYDDFLSDFLDDIGSNFYGNMTKKVEREQVSLAKKKAKDKMKELYDKA
jgi:hypothetical protein